MKHGRILLVNRPKTMRWTVVSEAGRTTFRLRRRNERPWQTAASICSEAARRTTLTHASSVEAADGDPGSLTECAEKYTQHSDNVTRPLWEVGRGERIGMIRRPSPNGYTCSMERGGGVA